MKPARLPVMLAWVLAAPCGAAADIASGLQECARIEATQERVDCYDALAGRSPAPTQNAPAPGPKTDEVAASRLDRYWELQESAERGTFVLLPYRQNYLLPASYNFSPNQVPYAGTDFKVEKLEVKFQFSFKFKLWQDMFDTPADLWFGYTQQSYWQLYSNESSPFRETNYEPTIFVGLPVDYPVLGLRARMFALGFTHQSNGRGEPQSRSWNRVVATAIFERGNLAGQVRAWYRIPEDASVDDNPDIEKYMGHGEVSLSYLRGRNEWTTTLKNLFNPDHGGIELGWSFPFGGRTPVRGYVQYYYGYGESMIDYNSVTNRLSLGVLVNDWF